MTTALLDGDIVAFRCSVAVQRDHDWGDGIQTSHTFAQDAADNACHLVDAWRAIAGCKDVVVTFTGKDNFRHRILPTYKANRAGKVKPLAYAYTVEAIERRFDTRVVEGLEADDLMGIMATTLPKYDGAVVVTIDKDLRGVPGRHLNPLKDRRPAVVTERDANRTWLLQTLTGDKVDGYAGIPGVGPKKAEAILGGESILEYQWLRVVEAYRDAGLAEADALKQARVARILRRSDYDKDSKEIILWHPTTPTRIPAKAVLTSPGEPPSEPPSP